jgi:protein TonB
MSTLAHEHWSTPATSGMEWGVSPQLLRKLPACILVLGLHLLVIWQIAQPTPQQPIKKTPPEVTVSLIPATPAPAAPVVPKQVAVVQHAQPQAPSLPIKAEPQHSLPPVLTDKVVAAVETAAPHVPTLAPPEPPKPMATPAPVTPRTLTSGIEYIRAPRPEYPSAARRRGDEGSVLVRILVNEQGVVERADIESSSGKTSLDLAGLEAARRALFKPYVENGKAMPVYALVPIHFKLDI